MQKKNVDVSAKHTIRYRTNQELEYYSYKSAGELIVLKNSSRLNYKPKNGKEHTVRWWHEDGSVNPAASLVEVIQEKSRFRFNLKNKTQTLYETPLGTLELEVLTKAINWKVDQEAYELEVDYELLADEESVADYKFRLQFTV